MLRLCVIQDCCGTQLNPVQGLQLSCLAKPGYGINCSLWQNGGFSLLLKIWVDISRLSAPFNFHIIIIIAIIIIIINIPSFCLINGSISKDGEKNTNAMEAWKVDYISH